MHGQRMANSIKENHILSKAREEAERERALIDDGHKQIEMTSTGNLVELAKDNFKSIGDIAMDTYGKIKINSL